MPGSKLPTRTLRCKVERLTAILADMLRSALAWEQEYGEVQPHNSVGHLTGIHSQYTLSPPENEVKGEDDDDNNDSKRETPDL